ncbi:MAG TPA: SRPBCC family protein, partial [Gemmataceae bacterium]|nr:SRPBCC family protein [Gemmataceae bacterium]
MSDSTFTLRSAMPASAEEVYAWHGRPGAFQRMQPPWEPITVQSTAGAFGTDGYRITIRTGFLGPIKGTWVAEAYDFQPGRSFRDRQLSGPFARWDHTHRMIPDGPDSSFLEEHIEYRVPLGAAGRLLTGGMVRRRLAKVFAYRHALTASDLRRHAKYRDRPRLKVVVTGSRGLIGSELVLFLTTG